VYSSGEEAVTEDEDEILSKAVEGTRLDGTDEEGWSTEGEGEEAGEEEGEVAEELSNKKVPLGDVARDVTARAGDEKEDIRTRVLTVFELEDLFQHAAPDLNGRDEVFRKAVH
jgi:large subunit GTPase 1